MRSKDNNIILLFNMILYGGLHNSTCSSHIVQAILFYQFNLISDDIKPTNLGAAKLPIQGAVLQ